MASYANPSAPTCSGRREGSVLLTYRYGNGSWDAVDGEAAWSVLEDDGGGFRCSSSSGDGGLTREALIRWGDGASSGSYDS
jgi:hypothetical protein